MFTKKGNVTKVKTLDKAKKSKVNQNLPV